VWGAIGLKAGKHAISVGMHYGFGGDISIFALYWKVPGQASGAVVPASRLFHIGAPVAAVPFTPLNPAHTVQREIGLVYNMRGQIVVRHDRAFRGPRIAGVYLVPSDQHTNRMVRIAMTGQ